MTYPGIDNDAAAVAENPDRVAVEERRKLQEEEFGTYRAEQDIPWGNVTAFYTGEAVPKSTVERYGWLDMGLVSRTTAADAKVSPESAAEPAAPDAKTTPPTIEPAVKPATSKIGGNS